MKALSIKQPWAWLITNGHKDIENRSWRFGIRGPVFVHAGKKIDKQAIADLKAYRPDIELPDQFETGGIVGQMTIADCVTESESFWFTGEYGYVISEAKPLPFRPLKGQLGFFTVPETG